MSAIDPKGKLTNGEKLAISKAMVRAALKAGRDEYHLAYLQKRVERMERAIARDGASARINYAGLGIQP